MKGVTGSADSDRAIGDYHLETSKIYPIKQNKTLANFLFALFKPGLEIRVKMERSDQNGRVRLKSVQQYLTSALIFPENFKTENLDPKDDTQTYKS